MGDRRNRKMDFCSILVAPNEDGFGPSTFAFYIVKEIMKQWEAIRRQLDLSLEDQPDERHRRLKGRWPEGLPELRTIFRIWGKTPYIKSLFAKEIDAGTVELAWRRYSHCSLRLSDTARVEWNHRAL